MASSVRSLSFSSTPRIFVRFTLCCPTGASRQPVTPHRIVAFYTRPPVFQGIFTPHLSDNVDESVSIWVCFLNIFNLKRQWRKRNTFFIKQLTKLTCQSRNRFFLLNALKVWSLYLRGSFFSNTWLASHSSRFCIVCAPFLSFGDGIAEALMVILLFTS